MARKTIRLDGSRITNRKDMAVYMKEIFSFPETFGGNLDALHDCLSEVNADLRYLEKHGYQGCVSQCQ